ncbi:hypothetical protein KP509_09G017600 [Ceratopteris richardii]|uniref:Uncharacterized protein n=1 Tax=Ceratopteris richardii TaxID=49495 RepID=A0A8T2U8D1_CERRI|nr:hypothetical protein KP509_09G017600 [Ceratopteris richardii]
MDLAEPEELQFLSLWGLVRESVKVIRSHGKLFVALTLTLILPLCIVGLGHNLITEPIANRINWDQFQLTFGRPDPGREERIDQDLHKELRELFIVIVLYIIALLAFSLLSTSAIVYSVACIYSEKITSYKKVLSVVPRVWKRLMVTFFWAIVIMFMFGFLSTILVFILAAVFGLIFQGSEVVINVVVWTGMVGLLVGVIYLSCVWHLASVVTVLEENCGLGAMKKSLNLIKGKQFVAFCLFFMYFVLTFWIGLGFRVLVVRAMGSSVVWRTFFGCLLILLMSIVDLMGFVLQTVFYFACKAHHHESIDRLQLSEHLGSYLGEYVPLRGSIQLESVETH